jgi:hypothetical protein
VTIPNHALQALTAGGIACHQIGTGEVGRGPSRNSAAALHEFGDGGCIGRGCIGDGN